MKLTALLRHRLRSFSRKTSNEREYIIFRWYFPNLLLVFWKRAFINAGMVVNFNPRRAGGGFRSPQFFFLQIAGKRRRTAPPNFAYLFSMISAYCVKKLTPCDLTSGHQVSETLAGPNGFLHPRRSRGGRPPSPFRR